MPGCEVAQERDGFKKNPDNINTTRRAQRRSKATMSRCRLTVSPFIRHTSSGLAPGNMKEGVGLKGDSRTQEETAEFVTD